MQQQCNLEFYFPFFHRDVLPLGPSGTFFSPFLTTLFFSNPFLKFTDSMIVTHKKGFYLGED